MSSVTTPDISLELEKLRLDFLFEKGINFNDRSIKLDGEVGADFCFWDFDNAMSELERHNKKPITLKINSIGGSVTEALAIIGRMKASKCKIHIEVYGEAFSAATLILAFGNKRKVSRFATLMHHEISYPVSGRHSGNINQVDQYKKEWSTWCDWLATCTKKPASFWMSKSKQDYFISPEEAVLFGLADEIF